MSTLAYNAGGRLSVSGVVSDASGAGVDLTGATSALWVMWAMRDGKIIAQNQATVGDQATPGAISYSSDTDISQPGFYRGVFRVVTASGEQVTWPEDPYLIDVHETLNGSSITQAPGFQPASVADLASYDTTRLARLRRAYRDRDTAFLPAAVTPAFTLAQPVGSAIPGSVLTKPLNPDNTDTGVPFEYLNSYGLAYGSGGVDVNQIRPTTQIDGSLVLPPYSVRWGMSGVTEFSIRTKAIGNAAYRLRIDGRFVQPTEAYLGGTAGQVYEVHVTGLDDGPHVYQLDFSNAFWFGGVYADPGVALWRPGPPGIKAVLVSDSTGGGANPGGPAGATTVAVWWQQFCDLMGWDEAYNASIGGTGMIVAPTFEHRVTGWVTSVSPDVIIVSGSRNDHVSPLASVQAAAASLYAKLAADNPHALLVAFGPWRSTAAQTQDYIDVNTAVRAAALAGGVPFVDMVAGEALLGDGTVVVSDGAWITGTGYYGHTAGDGNADWAVGPDDVHPSAAGHQYWALRGAGAVRSIIDALPGGSL